MYEGKQILKVLFLDLENSNLTTLYGTDIVWLASLRSHYSLKSNRLGKN